MLLLLLFLSLLCADNALTPSLGLGCLVGCWVVGAALVPVGKRALRGIPGKVTLAELLVGRDARQIDLSDVAVAK